MKQALLQLWDQLLDLIFVPLCPVCRQPCRGCACPSCTQELGRCLEPHVAIRADMDFDSAVAAFSFEHEAVKSLVYSLKHHATKNDIALCSQILYQIWQKMPILQNVDVLCWVPRSVKNARRHGFDQAQLLCKALSQLLQIPCEDLLYRTRRTRVQKKLDRRERLKNVKGLFAYRHKVPGGVALLIDDTLTTGATADAASRCLRKAGFDRVRVLCLASVEKEYSGSLPVLNYPPIS